MVDKFCKDAQAINVTKQQPNDYAALPRTTAEEDESEDDCGLEFVDPEAIRKAE